MTDKFRTDTLRTALRSDEFSCPSCVAKIEKALKALPGVADAKVHFNTGRIEIDHDPQTAPVDDLVGAVSSAGYEARPTAF